MKSDVAPTHVGFFTSDSLSAFVKSDSPRTEVNFLFDWYELELVLHST